MKKPVLISLLFAFFILIIAGINSFKVYKNPAESGGAARYLIGAQEAALVNNSPDSHSIGADSPLVSIVEFGDFSCAYCKNSFPTIREMSVKYQDKIKFVYRHYPIISEHSFALALAAECAGEQGRFWAMHDTLFLNQGISADNEIKELARQIGLNGAGFDSCLDDKKYSDKISADFETGQELKITGTPTWFINGIRVAGDIPRDIFFGLIDNLIIQNNDQ